MLQCGAIRDGFFEQPFGDQRFDQSFRNENFGKRSQGLIETPQQFFPEPGRECRAWQAHQSTDRQDIQGL